MMIRKPQAILLNLFLCLGASQAAFADPALVINQTCGVLGDQVVSISDKQVRIEDKATGIVTTASAPDWKVVTIDPKTKTFAECPLESFNGYVPELAFVDPGTRWSRLPLVADKPAKVAAFDADTFTTPPSYTDQQTKAWQQESASMTFAKSARYWVSSKVPVPKQAIRLLARFYQLPEKDGIPLQFKYFSLAGHMTTWLFTTSAARTETAFQKTSLAADFRKVATAADVRNTLRGAEKKERKKRPLL